jgi:hypothetical protein
MTGTALATSGIGGLEVTGAHLVRRAPGFLPADRRFLKMTFASAIALAAGLVLSTIYPQVRAGRPIFVTAGVVLTYTGSLVLLGLDVEDFATFRSITASKTAPRGG